MESTNTRSNRSESTFWIGSNKQSVETELEEIRNACDRAESQVSGLRFSYSDPEPHFDRSRVKGLVAELIEVREERFTNAIEVCAGGKLYQVVVDTDETGSALLKKGRLRRRVTIIPLNRIRHHTLPPAKVLQAQRLAPKGNVSLALTLVGYSESVQEAIEYVFGTTLVCETLDVARKVAFHPGVRTRTITLDGDIFDPSGVLEGGARSRSVPVLQLLSEANQLRDRRVALEQEAIQLRSSFERLRGKRQEQQKVQGRLELELHNMEVLEKSMGGELMRLEGEKASKEKEIAELRSLLEEAKSEERRGEAHLKELEAKEREMKEASVSSVNVLMKSVEACRDSVKKKAKAAESEANEAEEQRLEEEEQRRQLHEMEATMASQREALAAHAKVVETLEAKMKAMKEEYDRVKREANAKREEAHRQSEEIQEYQKELEALNREIEEAESKRKQVSGRKAKLQKARAEAENRMQSLLSQFAWLKSEESEFGKEGTDFDFAHLNLKELRKRISSLEEEQEQLGRRLNKKVLGMMEKAESEYQELLKKRRIIENDRSQIVKVIDELDVKKKETLASTYAKVNRDFGSIFSTLLPGASARLDPPSGGTVLDGLEVRVAFGGKEKESLSELSGGQRSLLALSLVLALLLFKPAPMYILDEVDAALDLSHTQNIGKMLRKHFGQSQFIVVSLKEGMFTNANVIFRTKFVDGVSTVTRTVGQIQDEEREGEEEKGKESKRRHKSSWQCLFYERDSTFE